MPWKSVVATLAGVVLTTISPLPSPAAPATSRLADTPVVGLWDTGASAQMTAADCGRWRLDAQGFCVADDTRNGLELGVKFQSERAVVVTGIRVYRVDPGVVTGTLWNDDGSRLATGTFAASATSGWQDLTFSRPVSISPWRTYVASYHSPGTNYAFTYGFFSQQLTRGPITALRSVGGDPNGVHCYDVGRCRSFPTNGFRDSGYWVTPLWESPTDEPVPPPASPAPPSDMQAPNVDAVTPRGGTTKVGLRQTIRIRFSEPVREALLTGANVQLLRKGQRASVRATLRYDELRHRMTLRPAGGLRSRSAYRVVISNRIVDIAGNELDADPATAGAQQATWRFRTR